MGDYPTVFKQLDSSKFLTENTVAGVWKKLEEIYLQKSVTNGLRLKQRFHSLKMAEGTSVKAHISDYSTLFNDIEKIGIQVDRDNKAVVLLYSLPKLYKGFKEIMLHGLPLMM